MLILVLFGAYCQQSCLATIQNPPVEQDITNQQQQTMATIARHLHDEVDLIKTVINIDDRFFEEFKSECEAIIKLNIIGREDQNPDAEHASKLGKGTQRDTEQWTRSMLLKKLPEDKQAELSAYIESAARLEAFLDERAQQAVVFHFDNLLSFTEEQEEELLAHFQKNWNPIHNHQIAAALVQQILETELAESLCQSDMWNQLLTETQNNVLSNYQKSELSNLRSSTDFPELDEVRRAFQPLAALRILEFTDQCELSPKQQRLLNVAMKGAINKRFKEWQRVIAELEALDEIYSNLEGIRMIHDPLIYQMEAQPIWIKGISKALSPQQQELRARRNAIREKRSRQALLGYVRMTIAPKQTYQQTLLFEEIISQHIFVEGEFGFVDPLIRSMALEDEILKPFFTPSQWQEISPQIEEQRQMAQSLVDADSANER